MQRYFDHHSLLREVVGHRLTALSGPRALLLMAAHPLAFAGFFAHTGALADPYGRLRRTARVMDAVAFGTAAQAERMTAPVRRMHAAVQGELPEAIEAAREGVRGRGGSAVPGASGLCMASAALGLLGLHRHVVRVLLRESAAGSGGPLKPRGDDATPIRGTRASPIGDARAGLTRW